MEPALASLPQNARVLVLRLRSLGDCVLTTPALRLLKQRRADLRIAVAVEDRFRDVFTGNPDIEAIIRPEARAVVAWRPWVTINFHGGPTSLRLTLLSLARLRAGFAHFPHNWAYNLRIPRAQQILGVERKVHTAEHLASAMFWLGVPPAEIPRAALYAPPPSVRSPYAVIHPFASAASKAWPAERFLAVARECGLAPVFIGGPGDDFSPFRDFECQAGASLKQVMSLISGAALFAGNDSGPAHIAAAFGRPLVVLYGTSDPVVWAPWRTAAETLVANGPVDAIPTQDVLDAIRRLKVCA
jgi:ADP-heptose:LPS heptosyltransferase